MEISTFICLDLPWYVFRIRSHTAYPRKSIQSYGCNIQTESYFKNFKIFFKTSLKMIDIPGVAEDGKRTSIDTFQCLRYIKYVFFKWSSWKCTYGSVYDYVYERVHMNKKWYLIFFCHHRVLPKGRSFTAGSGTKVAVLSKGSRPPHTPEPRLQFSQRQVFLCKLRNQRMQFCPKAGLPLQTQEPKLLFCPKAGLPLQTQKPTLQFCQKAGLLLQTHESSLLPQTQEPRLQSVNYRIAHGSARY